MGSEVIMKFLQTATLAAVCAALPAFAVDQGLLQYVPADAKSVAGVYVDRAVASPTGQFLQSQAAAGNADFLKFITATGFDPRRDLREVVFTSTDTQTAKKSGLVIARGNFKSDQIGALTMLQGGTKESFEGVDVYLTSGKHGQAVAFPEQAIALFGDASSVQTAISNRTKAIILDPRLAAKVQAASGKYDVWFAGLGPQNIGLGKAWKAQEGIDLVSGGVTLGSTVLFNAEAVMRSEKDAQGLVGLVKFIAGMAQMQQSKTPEMDRLFGILKSAETRVDGTTVSFSISAPESDLEILFRGPRRLAAVRQ